MKYGYARVSTTDQNLDRQIAALTAAGCDIIFQEKASGKDSNRPELQKLLSIVKEDDVVVVLKLDRLGRSVSDLIQIITGLGDRKVQFISLGEAIDTTTPTGKLLFHVMGAIAEFERSLIVERVNSGIAHAQAHGTRTGRPFGRPATKSTPENLSKVRRMVEDGKHANQIAAAIGVTRPDVYKMLRKLGITDLYSQKQRELKRR